MWSLQQYGAMRECTHRWQLFPKSIQAFLLLTYAEFFLSQCTLHTAWGVSGNKLIYQQLVFKHVFYDCISVNEWLHCLDTRAQWALPYLRLLMLYYHNLRDGYRKGRQECVLAKRGKILLSISLTCHQAHHVSAC